MGTNVPVSDTQGNNFLPPVHMKRASVSESLIDSASYLRPWTCTNGETSSFDLRFRLAFLSEAESHPPGDVTGTREGLALSMHIFLFNVLGTVHGEHEASHSLTQIMR